MSSSYPLTLTAVLLAGDARTEKEKAALSHSAVNVKVRCELAVSKCHLQKVDGVGVQRLGYGV